MKDQWYWIVFVIVLLIVQAQCDLSLPEYTSKIMIPVFRIRESSMEYLS